MDQVSYEALPFLSNSNTPRTTKVSNYLYSDYALQKNHSRNILHNSQQSPNDFRNSSPLPSYGGNFLNSDYNCNYSFTFVRQTLSSKRPFQQGNSLLPLLNENSNSSHKRKSDYFSNAGKNTELQNSCSRFLQQKDFSPRTLNCLRNFQPSAPHSKVGFSLSSKAPK